MKQLVEQAKGFGFKTDELVFVTGEANELTHVPESPDGTQVAGAPVESLVPDGD